MIALIQSRLGVLRADPCVREAAQGALSSFGAPALGVLLSFLFSVILARFLGAEGAGLFFLALSIVMIAEAIGRFGLECSLARFVSAAHSQQDWGGVAGVSRHALRIGIAVSALMTVLVLLTAAPVANHLFRKPELQDLLLTLAAAIVPLALTRLYGAALRGAKRVLIYQLLQNALPVALVISLLIPLDLQFGKSHGAALAYVAGWGLALCIGWWCWSAVMESLPAAQPTFERTRLIASCVPTLAVTMSALLLTQLPVLFIGIWSDGKEVATFSAAVRVALLGAFVLHSVVSIFSSKSSELVVLGRLEGPERMAKRTVMLGALCVVPLWGTVLLFPGPVLALFGGEFRQGAEMLMILFTGQMLFGIFGVGEEILIKAGHEHLVRRINFLSLLICFIACLLFIPAHGGIGAAIAINMAYAGHMAMCQFNVRRHFGFWLVPSLAGGARSIH